MPPPIPPQRTVRHSRECILSTLGARTLQQLLADHKEDGVGQRDGVLNKAAWAS